MNEDGRLIRSREDSSSFAIAILEGDDIAIFVETAAPPRKRRAAVLSEGRPIGIDLFAGVGGLSLGFEQAGFDIVASVEYDPVHAAVHKFNFPMTEIICGDVAKIDAADLMAASKRGFVAHGRDLKGWSGEIDVIFGGPPCQGFSTMGKRDIGDDRNQLVYKFADLIGAIRPRYFVMENVPGMASGGHANILSRLLSRFKLHGYEISVAPEKIRTAILNAADFGVPQDRKRLILLGTRQGQRLARYPSPSVRRVAKRGEVDGRFEALDNLPKGPTVADALRDLPDLDAFDELWASDEVHLGKRERARMKKLASQYAKRLNGLIEDEDDYSHQRLWKPEVLTSSLRTEHTLESVRRFNKTKQGEVEEISRFYRLHSEGLCNTLRAGTGSERGAYTSPRPLHPDLPRVISVREAARIHSFPDWFRLHRTKWNGFRSIGNAVPPLFGRAIARCIMEAMDRTPIKPRDVIPLGDPRLLTFDRMTAAHYFGAELEDIPKSRKHLAKP